MNRSFPEKLNLSKYVNELVGFRIREVDSLYTRSREIHDGIADISWVSALWNAVMGDQTLADVVAGIFTGVTSALQTVKDGLSKAWDGIRSAGQFVTNTVLDAIGSGISSLLNKFIRVLLISINSVLGTEIRAEENLLRINNEFYRFAVQFNNSKLNLVIFNSTIALLDLSSMFEVETLGPKEALVDIYQYFTEGTGLEMLKLSITMILGEVFLSTVIGISDNAIATYGQYAFYIILLAFLYQLFRSGGVFGPKPSPEVASALSEYNTFMVLYLMMGLLVMNKLELDELTLKLLISEFGTVILAIILETGLFNFVHFMSGNKDVIEGISWMPELLATVVTGIMFVGELLAIRRVMGKILILTVNTLLIITHLMLAIIWDGV